MRVSISLSNCGIDKNKYPVINLFISYLQKHYPLNQNIEIFFVGKRVGFMTTASRMKGQIKVFCKKRILRDILRSLAHEWFHEYEELILKIPHTKHIGGKNENLANSESGKIIKKFEVENPELEKHLYS
jgi:hypothetical protein